MVIVRLNDWEEFLAEIRSDKPRDRIVRLTLSAHYDGRGEPQLTMVAGYLNGANIIEFVHYLGLQPRHVKSDRAQEIEALFEQRRQDLESQGLLVKPGRYHAPPTTIR